MASKDTSVKHESGSNKKKRKHMESSDKHQFTLEQELDSQFDKPSKKSHGKAKKRQQQNDEFVDESLTDKIIREARKQQKEMQEERDDEDGLASARKVFDVAINKVYSDSDEDDVDELVETMSHADIEEIDEEDEKLLAQFYAVDAVPQRTLVNFIKEKIGTQNISDNTIPGLSDDVISIYKGVGQILSRYTTGKLPKALKVVPSLTHWEEVLYLTEPTKWSPNAMYQVTRIFVSNRMQRWLNGFATLCCFHVSGRISVRTNVFILLCTKH
eukprot:TRINITY_DN7997_c0_g1_i1.p1 TRINITY_DN7997_c0_g1~~TRINITY_DN7997_c0_g1_i1.p1  ORF type:complete len:271 (+),score=63.48 TRINITY_DN7997_c0_g1_i1:531-1343(+)